jgi:DNA-directed RNA polymerase specialized sigma24 family protein
MDTLTSSAALTQLSHEELIHELAAAPHRRAVMKEFISRYDDVIRRAATQALFKCKGAADPQSLQAMIEDSVNETYCRLFLEDCRALRSFKGHYENSIFAYLRTITRNTVHNQMRQHRRHWAPGSLQSLEAMNDKSAGRLADCGWGVSEWAVESGKMTEAPALTQLVHGSFRFAFSRPNVNRNFIIFKLYFLYGYRSEEIAHIKGLSLSVQGVYVTADRMRQWLRQDDGPARFKGARIPQKRGRNHEASAPMPLSQQH